MEPVVVEEVSPRQRKVVALLAPLLGLLTFTLVLGIGSLIAALTDAGTVALAVVVVVVAVAVGVAVTWSVLRGARRDARNPSCTTFAPDGITRVQDGSRMSSSWAEVSTIFITGDNAFAGDMLALATDPAFQLVADNPMARKRAEFNERLYGATVAMPVAALPVPADELSDRIVAWSGGIRQIGRGRPS